MCFTSYCSWKGKSMFLEDLYVRPNYRVGGIGRKLFEKIVNFAREMECKKLDFEVFSWNPAMEFYKKMGAVHCDQKADRINFSLSFETNN